MQYLPDRTLQVDALRQYTLGHVRKELGRNPFLVSCHLCFAQSFSEDKLNEFLALKYGDLDQALGTWDGEASKGAVNGDFFPPNFHYLVQTALAKTHKKQGPNLSLIHI